MRLLFALPGLHRVNRGAEVAFESIAQEIASEGEHDVKLIGSGFSIAGRAYRFEHVAAISRERFEGWPTLPLFRNEYSYEDFTFAAGLITRRGRTDADVTVTSNYPYTNWALRAGFFGPSRPAHVFVTQNGDWPAYERRREYRFFSCDGLVCTNPIYWRRNRERWFTKLIPNGIDPTRFRPGPADRSRLGLPENRPIVLMVSALYRGKRIIEGLSTAAKIDDIFCVVAGDGPLRDEVDRLGAALLPGRFLRRTFPRDLMPLLYRSANVFLHTAIRESFGNVYIEALASGIPVVAHDDEVTRWILGDHGYLVDTTVEQMLLNALRHALLAPVERSRSAMNFAHERYSWRSIAARYCEFFKEVLDRTG
jgi:glycosyltransferase involved in cell wall biosynthesis